MLLYGHYSGCSRCTVPKNGDLFIWYVFFFVFCFCCRKLYHICASIVEDTIDTFGPGSGTNWRGNSAAIVAGMVGNLLMVDPDTAETSFEISKRIINSDAFSEPLVNCPKCRRFVLPCAQMFEIMWCGSTTILSSPTDGAHATKLQKYLSDIQAFGGRAVDGDYHYPISNENRERLSVYIIAQDFTWNADELIAPRTLPGTAITLESYGKGTSIMLSTLFSLLCTNLSALTK